jgi:hypothetical protein
VITVAGARDKGEVGRSWLEPVGHLC